ncbi:MAG: NIPSNAP family protein [Prosthecobacter sp.]
MTRSTFLKTTVAAAGLAANAPAAETSGREYIEIRKITLKSPEKQTLLETYLRDAAIPALNRMGVSHVGVFLPEKSDSDTVLYVLLRHASLETVAKSADLLSEASVQQAGSAYLSATADDPVYERIESWLTRGIGSMPGIKLPPNGSSLYQLRIYESHNEKAAKKKIEMFDVGELAIFARCGLNAVFFGETILGPLMPNLTYMLAFADSAAKDAAWNAFRADPEWVRLKAVPGFTDKEIVTRITNLLLVPAACSQIR